MTEMELYQSWRKNAIDDPDLQSELSAIENDAEAIQEDRKSTRLNSSHSRKSRMPSSA